MFAQQLIYAQNFPKNYIHFLKLYLEERNEGNTKFFIFMESGEFSNQLFSIFNSLKSTLLSQVS
jgi:hypothetical protein